MARDSCSPLNFSVYFLVVGKFSQKKHWQEVNFSPTNSENLAGLTANLESGCGQVSPRARDFFYSTQQAPTGCTQKVSTPNIRLCTVTTVHFRLEFNTGFTDQMPFLMPTEQRQKYQRKYATNFLRHKHTGVNVRIFFSD